MDQQQQLNFIEYVRAARSLAANPHSRATAQRPWRVSIMWRDVGGFDGMNFHVATELDAQHATFDAGFLANVTNGVAVRHKTAILGRLSTSCPQKMWTTCWMSPTHCPSHSI